MRFHIAPNFTHVVLKFLAVLTDLGNGWSMVEGRKPDGNGPDGKGKGNCFGFIASRALSTLNASDVPDPPGWSSPLAKVRLNPGEKMEQVPVIETPSQYCQRTAWTPELFVMELKAKSSMDMDDNSLNPAPEQLLAIR